jgi:glycosyltransferase involved in cell wall biosynthesis
VGIAIDDTWAFFNEIFADLSEHHQTSLFEPKSYRWPVFKDKLNPYFYDRYFKNFLRSNQVVFFEWGTSLLKTASQYPKSCGIVTRLHRYELYDWADHINWQVVDKIILVSKAKQREFAARFPMHAEKVIVIPEGVPLEKFQFQPRKFNGDIGILCHISPRKRVYELILAFYELQKQSDGFHLHVGGGKRRASWDYYEALHRLVDHLGIQDKITFYGNVVDSQSWYHNVDIFISNSYSEGLQVSPMEAIASGCYCLSHWWDGADELLPEENLYLTAADLNDKILRYSAASEAEKLKEITALQDRIYACFDMDKIKGQIRQVIEEVGASMGARDQAKL